MLKSSIILGSLLLLATVLAPVATSAQTDGRLYIHWRAETYAPPSFEGKILVSPKSTLLVSASAIVQSKLQDLSSKQILWYSNGELVEEGMGADLVRMRAPERPGALFEIRAEIPSLGLIETIEVPIYPVLVVIESPLLDGVLTSSEVILRAWPYFFVGNPDLFQYNWSVNGKYPDETEDPRALRIQLGADMPLNTVLDVRLRVEGGSNLEQAVGSRVIYYRP